MGDATYGASSYTWDVASGFTITQPTMTFSGWAPAAAKPKRRDSWRLTASVAIGHAAFFLALAIAGWAR